jgi:hypothetical protein
MFQQMIRLKLLVIALIFFAVICLASEDAFADVHYARPLTGH